MLSFDISVTGGQVGRALQSDPEELAEALKELADGFPDDIGEETADYLGYPEKRGVKVFLKNLLEALGDD